MLSSRPMMFSSVDLPQPEGPMIDTNSPLLILILISFSAVVSISSVRKALVTFCSDSIGDSSVCIFLLLDKLSRQAVTQSRYKKPHKYIHVALVGIHADEVSCNETESLPRTFIG